MTVLCPAESGSHRSSSDSFWVLGELLVMAQLQGGTEVHVSRQFKKETNQDLKEITNSGPKGALLAAKRRIFHAKNDAFVLNRTIISS